MYHIYIICNIYIVRNIVRNVCFTNMLTNILPVSYRCYIVTVCVYTHGDMYTICKCTRNSIHARR